MGIPAARATITIPFADLRGVDVGGAGEVVEGGGFVGGGFGVEGFLQGAATASLLNRLTTKKSLQTILRLTTAEQEINLFTSDVSPSSLDLALAAARLAIADRAAQPSSPDVVGQLERLAKLRDAGVLSGDEFETQKTKLLARL
jgi:hypothetical protein